MLIKDWIKTHKLATAGIATVIIIVALMAFFVLLVSLSGARSSSRVVGPEYPGEFSLSNPLATDFLLRETFDTGSKMPSDTGREIEVKEGSMRIDSKEAENDFSEIRSMVENYQGYVERSNKSVTSLYIQLDLTLRIPSEKFAGLVEKLQEEFKVEHYSIKNYRIPVGRELDELQILNKSLSDYEKIREEISEMRVGRDKIDLLMQLTEKELGLKEKEKIYQSLLSSKERQGEYATLNVNLRQKQSPTIWPENVLDQFKDRLRRSFDNSFAILRDLIGGSIEIFFRSLQIIIYIFIIGIVLATFYRLTRGLFGWIVRKK